MNSLRYLVTALALSFAAGCAEADLEPIPVEATTGQASLPLVVESEGIRYRLRPAEFLLRGPEGETLIDGGATDTLVLDLAPGDYSIELQEGWRLQAQGPDLGWVRQEAVLQSANPQSFTVEEQAATALVFRFGVGDAAIAFGLGRATVGIDVTDDDAPAEPEDPQEQPGVQGAAILGIDGELPCPGYAGEGLCFFAGEGLVADLLLRGDVVDPEEGRLADEDIVWTLIDEAGAETRLGTGRELSVGIEVAPRARTRFTLVLTGVDSTGEVHTVALPLAIDVLI